MGMNSRRKNDDDECSWLDLQALRKSFLDLESYTHKNKLGIDHENIPKRVYLRPKMEEEKDMKNQFLNTYMCWRMIKMVLEFLSSYLIYSWITRMKKMVKFLEVFLMF
jgi:hypothetical protein